MSIAGKGRIRQTIDVVSHFAIGCSDRNVRRGVCFHLMMNVFTLDAEYGIMIKIMQADSFIDLAV